VNQLTFGSVKPSASLTRYLADNLQYAFLAYLRADVQLAQPTAFAVDTGVRT
jgi:hypothetical protein